MEDRSDSAGSLIVIVQKETIIYTRDNGGLGQGGGSGGDEKWLYYGHTLKIGSMGFPN